MKAMGNIMYHSVWIVWLLTSSISPTHGHAHARFPTPKHSGELSPPKTCITNPHLSTSAPHPAITDPPRPALDKRASSTVSSNTCGWVNGTYGSGIYCGIDRTCVFYTPAAADTAPPSLPGMAGCCRSADRADCFWRRTCYASSEMSASCTDSACLSDRFVLRCTNSTAPACASWTYPGVGGARDYACTLAESVGNWTTVLQTGVDDFFTPATTYTVDVVFAEESEVLSTSSVVSTSASGSGAVETAATETGTPGQGGGGGGGGGVSIGAIVGGVVGGVVGVALVVVAVVVLCCVARKKKRRTGKYLDGSGMVHEADGSFAMGANAAELHGRSSRYPVELENVERQRPVEMPSETRYELH